MEFGDYISEEYFERQREELVLRLKEKGIISDSVLQAILNVPREYFVIEEFKEDSYSDTALPIDCDQTISQPYTVAYMSSCLNVKKYDKILEIGTGSGYQAAILAALGAKVFTIERIKELYLQTQKKFKNLGLNVNCFLGDGTIGLSKYAPYNGIIVTAAAPKIPKALLKQLAIGGRLVVPVGDKSSQRMHIIERKDEKNFKEYLADEFRFVPLIGRDGWNEDSE